MTDKSKPIDIFSNKPVTVEGDDLLFSSRSPQYGLYELMRDYPLPEPQEPDVYSSYEGQQAGDSNSFKLPAPLRST